MRVHGYPELEKQQKMHAKMVEYLNEFIEKSENMEAEEIETEIAEFIEERFLVHIVTQDSKIHEWMTNRE